MPEHNCSDLAERFTRFGDILLLQDIRKRTIDFIRVYLNHFKFHLICLNLFKIKLLSPRVKTRFVRLNTVSTVKYLYYACLRLISICDGRSRTDLKNCTRGVI